MNNRIYYYIVVSYTPTMPSQVFIWRVYTLLHIELIITYIQYVHNLPSCILNI